MDKKYKRVCFTRMGYAIVPGGTDEEVLAAAKELSPSAIDWEPLNGGLMDCCEIVEDCGPDGE